MMRYCGCIIVTLLVLRARTVAGLTVPPLQIRDETYVIERLLDNLDSMNYMDDCTRRIVLIAKESCDTNVAKIPPDTRVELAVQLTLCELEYANVDTPCLPDLSPHECARLLHKRAQWWTSFSGYFQSIDSLCRGLRSDYEAQRVLDTYRNITALHGHFYTHFLNALAKSSQDVARIDMDRRQVVDGMHISLKDLEAEVSLLSDLLLDKAHGSVNLADSLSMGLSRLAVEANVLGKSFNDATGLMHSQQQMISKQLDSWSANVVGKLNIREQTLHTAEQAAIKNLSLFFDSALRKAFHEISDHHSEMLKRQQDLMGFVESSVGTATHLESLLHSLILSVEARSEEMTQLYRSGAIQDALHYQQDILTLSKDGVLRLENLIRTLNPLTCLVDKLSMIGGILNSLIWYSVSCFGLASSVSPRLRSFFVLSIGLYVTYRIFPIPMQSGSIFLLLSCTLTILIARFYQPVYFGRKGEYVSHTPHLMVDRDAHADIYDLQYPITLPVCLERRKSDIHI